MRNPSFITISPGFCILIAFSLLVLPIQWVLGWLLAAAVHESFHLLMLNLLRVKVYSVRLEGFGTIISTDSMDPIHEFLCAIAGPIGALTLLLFIRVYPQLAISALFQSVYNFLPFYPFDGGRALKSALQCKYEELRAERITTVIAGIALGVLIVGGLIVAVWYRLGFIPVLLSVFPVAYCKNSLQRK